MLPDSACRDAASVLKPDPDTKTTMEHFQVGKIDHQLGDATAFFERNGFDARTMALCDAFACKQFPGCKVTPVQPQGYCSYTLVTDTDHLIQFRPASFELDLNTSRHARAVYGHLVPRIEHIGTIRGIPVVARKKDEEILILHVYVQEKIRGVSLFAFRESMRYSTTKEVRENRRGLIEDIGRVFAIGFMRSQQLTRVSKEGDDDKFSISKGYVGSSLGWRLDLLQGLQGKLVRHHVVEAQQALSRIERLPWCLTHGDMVPANVMVDPATGRLTGLIDWAEGEWLPQGIGLYGLEELLGEETPDGKFRYYPEHIELREVFWKTFTQYSNCKLDDRAQVRDLALARRMGILLWRGLAFEDGRIDQLVKAGRDDMDICKLHIFLEADDGLGIYTRCGYKGTPWIQNILKVLGGWAAKIRSLWKRPEVAKDGHAVTKVTSATSNSTV